MERSYNRYHTLPEFLDWLYTHGFFSLYAQQRSACFLMWWNILSHCTQDLHDSPLAFLKQRALRRSDNSACLFPSTSAVVFDLDEQSLPTCLSKAAALTEIWDRLIKN